MRSLSKARSASGRSSIYLHEILGGLLEFGIGALRLSSGHRRVGGAFNCGILASLPAVSVGVRLLEASLLADVAAAVVPEVQAVEQTRKAVEEQESSYMQTLNRYTIEIHS